MNLQQNLRIISLANVVVNKNLGSQQQQRIVIDFSSPNIAKPFHFGHLKSTILGNFLANLSKYYGDYVTKLNYVGDWGTQYGLLSLGLDDTKLHPKLSSSSLDLVQLLEIYVEANKRGQEDENFYQKARQRFQAMDSGEDSELLDRWRLIRGVSLDELKHSYQQLGIEFDVFEFESDYAQQSRHLVDQLKARGQVSETEDGVQVTQVIKNQKVRHVPLIKSDGSSLYITRDIAAALHRRKQYNFDQLYYVVGADQERHFHSLREIIRQMGHAWADQLVHVKVGKVVGMSSRSGQAVLLSKIIQEATQVYRESTENVPTSKVSSNDDIDEVSKQLALSALFVYDLKNKRTKNYEFEWKSVMVPGDRSGIHLQTTYARLCSLIAKARAQRGLNAYESTDMINYDSICCIEGVNLIKVINELGPKLEESRLNLDASPLVNHALLLCRATNRARRSDWLHVMREGDDQKARSRLTLFESSRAQLEFIIKMIGLQPLCRV